MTAPSISAEPRVPAGEREFISKSNAKRKRGRVLHEPIISVFGRLGSARPRSRVELLLPFAFGDRQEGTYRLHGQYKPDAQDVTSKVKSGGGDAPGFWCWLLSRAGWYDAANVCGSRGTLEGQDVTTSHVKVRRE